MFNIMKFTYNYFSDCYGFTEDELKNVLFNFSISDSKEKIDKKSEELKNLLKISILNFDVEFLNLLCVADEEEYKENIKNMNKLIIKISSNDPKKYISKKKTLFSVNDILNDFNNNNNIKNYKKKKLEWSSIFGHYKI
ncbi:hypothetical protein U3516DRAFT_772582 [Neocallimastix sp. 'constans']